MDIKDAVVGVKVVAVDVGIKKWITHGKEYEVKNVNKVGDLVYIVDDRGEVNGYYAKRFDPAREVDNGGLPILKAGDVVKVADNIVELFDPNHQYFLDNPEIAYVGYVSRQCLEQYVGKEVKVVDVQEFRGVRARLEGPDGRTWWFNRHMVDLVGYAPVVAKPYEYKVDDIVFIHKAAKVLGMQWVDAMEKTIGTVAKIKAFNNWNKSVTLSNGWAYSCESIRLATDKDIAAAKAKKQKNVSMKGLVRAKIAEVRKDKKFRQAIINNNAVSAFAVIGLKVGDKNPSVTKLSSGPCHAAMATYFKPAFAVIDFLDTYKQQVPKEDQLTYKKLVHYVVNESPFRIAFKGKTVKNILDNGVELDVSQSASIVMAGVIALRYCKEFANKGYNKVAIARDLIKNKVSVEAAWLTMSFFNRNLEGQHLLTGMGGGHDIFSAYHNHSMSQIIRLLAEGFNKKALTGPSYGESQSGWKVHQTIAQTDSALTIKGTKDLVKYAKEFVGVENKAGFGAAQEGIKFETVLKFAQHIDTLLAAERAAILNQQEKKAA